MSVLLKNPFTPPQNLYIKMPILKNLLSLYPPPLHFYYTILPNMYYQLELFSHVMHLKLKVSNIDGAVLQFLFCSLHTNQFTKQRFHMGSMVQILSNIFLEVVDFVFLFIKYSKRFCFIFQHKLILKVTFLGLGWAQVYRSQLGLNLVS